MKTRYIVIVGIVASCASLIESGGFDKVVDISQSSRSIENSSGKLGGSVTTGTGEVIRLTMNLVKENGSWEINFISKRKSGLDSEE
jgi:hypothetical protein